MHHPLVLLVTDNADEQELYELGLSAHGFRVGSVRTLSDIPEAIERLRPDVLLLIVEVSAETWSAVEPGADPAFGGLPWVLLTGSVRPDASNRTRAKASGCAAFVAKPCLPNDLASVLRAVLAGQRGLIVMRGAELMQQSRSALAPDTLE